MDNFHAGHISISSISFLSFLLNMRLPHIPSCGLEPHISHSKVVNWVSHMSFSHWLIFIEGSRGSRPVNNQQVHDNNTQCIKPGESALLLFPKRTISVLYICRISGVNIFNMMANPVSFIQDANWETLKDIKPCGSKHFLRRYLKSWIIPQKYPKHFLRNLDP